MTSYRVHFSGVGRDRKAWVCNLNQRPTEILLRRLVYESGALLSQEVECFFDVKGDTGTIYAGARAVGRFRVEEQTT